MHFWSPEKLPATRPPPLKDLERQDMDLGQEKVTTYVNAREGDMGTRHGLS
jgi:hypothetical protein